MITKLHCIQLKVKYTFVVFLLSCGRSLCFILFNERLMFWRCSVHLNVVGGISCNVFQCCFTTYANDLSAQFIQTLCKIWSGAYFLLSNTIQWFNICIIAIKQFCGSPCESAFYSHLILNKLNIINI